MLLYFFAPLCKNCFNRHFENFTKVLKKGKCKIPAFSLIEISITLLIVGLVSSIMIPQLKSITLLINAQKDQSHLDFITKSIGAYYLSTYKIPYPSMINSNIGEQNESMKNSFGIVPFKTLGIMEKFAKTSNGMWILYKMNPAFGNKAIKDNLGISDFSGKINDDKIAIILKTQNSRGEDSLTVWYSEKNFIANFANNKLPPQNVGKTALPAAKF